MFFWELLSNGGLKSIVIFGSIFWKKPVGEIIENGPFKKI